MRKILFLFAIFIISSSSSIGQGWFWGKEATQSNESDEGVGAAIDHSKNIYLSGYFHKTLMFGKDSLYSYYYSTYLAKYSSFGSMIWAKQAFTPKNYNSENFGGSVATDPKGDVYIAGSFTDTISFDSTSILSNNGSGCWSAFLVKYDSSGNIIWDRKTGCGNSPGNGYANTVATDKYGNVYLAGTFKDSITFGVFTLISNNLTNIFLAKYDENGNFIWAQKSISNSSNISVKNVTTDAIGNVFITGRFSDSLEFGAKKIYSSDSSVFLAKYDANGSIKWVNQGYVSNVNPKYWGNIFYNISSNSVGTSKNGDSYITGGFYGTLILGRDTLNSIKHNGVFIAKYDSNGKPLWAKQSIQLDTNNWMGYAISTDTNNQFYLSAGGDAFSPTKYNIKFDSINLSASNDASDGVSVLVKFDSAGKALCGSIVNGGGDDVVAVIADPSGQYIYLGGDLSADYSITFGPDVLPGQLYMNETPFVARWQQCDNVSAINEISSTNSANVYPNPSNGKFNIQLSVNSGRLPIEVYNMLGERVYAETLRQAQGDNQIDLSNEPAGIYLYRITSEKGELIGSGKLVIQ